MLTEQNYPKVTGVEYNITKQWEKGIPHHPKSIALMNALCDIDFALVDDHFCWKTGGDGDNGESLMYELDIYFDELDALYKQYDLHDDIDWLVIRLNKSGVNVRYEPYTHPNTNISWRGPKDQKYTVYLNDRKVFSQTKLTWVALKQYLNSLLMVVNNYERT